jgi:hypothetical protein
MPVCAKRVLVGGVEGLLNWFNAQDLHSQSGRYGWIHSVNCSIAILRQMLRVPLCALRGLCPAEKRLSSPLWTALDKITQIHLRVFYISIKALAGMMEIDRFSPESDTFFFVPLYIFRASLTDYIKSLSSMVATTAFYFFEINSACTAGRCVNIHELNAKSLHSMNKV